jgi:uncharacterized protein YjbJ (UPF0337 family)
MKPSTKDQAKPKIKKGVGKVTNNPELEAEGGDGRLLASSKEKVSKVERFFNRRPDRGCNSRAAGSANAVAIGRVVACIRRCLETHWPTREEQRGINDGVEEAS